MDSNNCNSDEVQMGLDVLGFIESKQEFGATNTALSVKKKTHYYPKLNFNNFFFNKCLQANFSSRLYLVDVINALIQLNMVLVAGVHDNTFVHWKFVTPWLLSTYNIKRLEKVIFKLFNIFI